MSARPSAACGLRSPLTGGMPVRLGWLDGLERVQIGEIVVARVVHATTMPTVWGLGACFPADSERRPRDCKQDATSFLRRAPVDPTHGRQRNRRVRVGDPLFPNAATECALSSVPAKGSADPPGVPCRATRGAPPVLAPMLASTGSSPTAAGWTAATLSMPPPPMAATPGAGVGVIRFDQAQADQSPVLIHSLDRVAVQLQLADHGRWGVKPAARNAASDTGCSPARRSCSSARRC